MTVLECLREVREATADEIAAVLCVSPTTISRARLRTMDSDTALAVARTVILRLRASTSAPWAFFKAAISWGAQRASATALILTASSAVT